MTPIEQAREALSLIAELMDIQKRPHRYAARDEVEWKENRLPQLARLMDGVVADMEWEALQVVVDGQLHLNHEYKEAAGL